MRPSITQFRQILFWPLEILDASRQPCNVGALESCLKGPWERIPDLLEREPGIGVREEYAEMVYFHPFVQRFLYGEGDDSPPPIRLFRRTDVRGGKVKLGWWDGKLDRYQSFEIKLDVHRVDLYLFDRGVAILVVEVAAVHGCFSEGAGGRGPGLEIPLPAVEQFLDGFRRAYPPYWSTGSDREGHCVLLVDWLDNHGLLIAVNPPSRDPTRFAGTVIAGKSPQPSPHWAYLLSPLEPCSPQATGSLHYRQLEDERIPFMAYVAVDDPRTLTRGDFIRLCLADESGTSETLPYARDFLADFETKHCYDRYWGEGRSTASPPADPCWMTTRYLCSGYGFVMVGRDDRLDESPFFGDEKNGALAHFRRHYFQMGLIAHYQRAALLAFSDALSQAVARLDSNGEAAFHAQMSHILKGFLAFTQRYWFREVSNQVQARELFQLWTRNLETEALFEQVRQEAHDAKNFLDMEEQRRQTESTVRLSVVATLGLAAGLIGTWLAVPALEWQKPGDRSLNQVNLEIALPILGLLLAILFSRRFGRLFDGLANFPTKLSHWFQSRRQGTQKR